MINFRSPYEALLQADRPCQRINVNSEIRNEDSKIKGVVFWGWVLGNSLNATYTNLFFIKVNLT
jgi:hypothetical protein